LGGAPITGMRPPATRNPLKAPDVLDEEEMRPMQQPPVPGEPQPDTPEPSQPGQPQPAPPETPTRGPDIDIPSPGTQPTTPVSPVG
jgi:hypothetical protein